MAKYKQSKKSNKKKVSSKNMQIKAKALFLDEQGRGVVKHENKHIPVENLLPNEYALIDIEQRGKYFHTHIKSLIEKSENRVNPQCPNFYDCGGCQLLHMDYSAQLKFKHKSVQRLFPGKQITPVVGMDEPYSYRNKVIATYAKGDKEVYSGFYKPYSHDVLPIESCMIQNEVADHILMTIKRLVKKFKIQAYMEDHESGYLRHVQIRTGYKTKEVMVTFVVAHKSFPSKKMFIKNLVDAHPEITSVIMNVNDRQTSVVLGQHEETLFGSNMIKDELCGYTFNISSKSFYQINPVQTEKLYNTAMSLADIQSDEVVLDTYCGIGTISIIASQYAAEVYGVEINKDAVRNAVKNAKSNRISNIRFVQDDASIAMAAMADEKFKIDTLFMDPPRSGSDDVFINATLKLKPKKIIYISCDPTTQARDIKKLERLYKVEKIVPVDMFPHTGHIETVMKLQRKSK